MKSSILIIAASSAWLMSVLGTATEDPLLFEGSVVLTIALLFWRVFRDEIMAARDRLMKREAPEDKENARLRAIVADQADELRDAHKDQHEQLRARVEVLSARIDQHIQIQRDD